MLEGLAGADWDAPSLCAGWRVREVVAHMTMPFRYSAPRFLAEMVRSRGDFARMADRVARRDAQAPVGDAAGRLADATRTTPWKPPGGGLQGALTHDVVHGLDITVPLGLEHPVGEPALRVVLDNATTPLSRKHFGLDLTGIRLEADDLDWAFGRRRTAARPRPAPAAGADGPPAARPGLLVRPGRRPVHDRLTPGRRCGREPASDPPSP